MCWCLPLPPRWPYGSDKRSAPLSLRHQKPFSCYAIAIAIAIAPSKATVNVAEQNRQTEIGRASFTRLSIYPIFSRILNVAFHHSKQRRGYYVGMMLIYSSEKIYLRERLRAHSYPSPLRSFSVRPNNGGLVFAGNRKLPGDHIRQEVPQRHRAVPVSQTAQLATLHCRTRRKPHFSLESAFNLKHLLIFWCLRLRIRG